ncbi:MAG: slipin family protein [Alphaproteobacteria bacterium]|nr:slipin family protein [Alphaproteobacteria bacterium]
MRIQAQLGGQNRIIELPDGSTPEQIDEVLNHASSQFGGNAPQILPAEIFVYLFLAILAALFVRALFFRSITIYDFQKGLLYRKGAFIKILGAGKHYYRKSSSVIHVIDTRKTLVNLPGQEILTKDNVNIKITLVGFYELTDPAKAKHQSEDFVTEFYNHAQIMLRNLVGGFTIDELLEKKGEIDAQLLTAISDKANDLGLTVSTLSVKDIMLPANLKKAFSGILEAQKEAQRQLEKARGEQAVLRNLANSSSMYESNPKLLQARLVQALSTGNNSIVFNAEDKVVVPEKSVTKKAEG